MRIIIEKLTELKRLINEHNINYYIHDKPIISDSEYDELLRELIKIEEKFPELVTQDSPTQRVGASPLSSFNTIEHRIPMLSLANAMNNGEIKDFDKQIKKFLSTEDEIEYTCEPKLDGLAVELVYENGIFQYGSTRGNGVTGEDITQNLRSIKSIPLKILDNTPPILLEIRGEVFINHNDFEKLNLSRLKNGEQPFANPRNCAAGSLRQLDSKISASRPLKINCYAFGVLDGVEFDSHSDFLNQLPKWGFPVNNLIKTGNGKEFLIQFKENIESLRENLKYDIDGVVFKVNSLKKQNELGNRSRSPRWAIAGKFKSRQATTVINNIIASVGRTGAVTPVAQLEPVKVGGVIVSNATLHNQDEIDRKDVRVGDTVIIQRAGDVIPEVVMVIIAKRKQKSIPYILPTHCPECKSEIIKSEGEVVARCQNFTCPAQIKGRLKHFVSKNCMDIDGFGEKLVEQLVDNNIISNISDIFQLEINDIKNLDRQGEKSAQNTIDSIDKSKTATLSRFIHGLGIRNVGEHASKILEKKFHTLENIISADLENLLEIHEVGEIMAKSITDFFSNQINIEMINNCIHHGLNFELGSKTNSNKFEGISFVFTGSLIELKRSEAKKIVEENGGQVGASISKKTNFVVAGENAGSKLKKAKDQNIPIISEIEFIKLLK
ncbi:MAG: NAD-dependent DNA ligase LigA [Candidatus Marinimicrobia bacterium]|nr:NAD-dependent DNA ligase LigA [Candidatus Neomarinimicrobiota bacterium]